MKFNYETQGAITYLVCELDATEQLDTLTLGMLTNNHIVGLAPVLYTEMNGQRFLKYNVSAKVSADQFFSGTMNKQRTLTAFGNILDAVCSADDYMIAPNCFSLEPEHIFFNVSSCEIAMLCVPTVNEKDINVEVSKLLKNILVSTQFDSNEDSYYITNLITYINSAEFNIYGLKDLIGKIQSGAIIAPPVAAAPTPTPVVQPQVQVPPVSQPATNVSPFDSTISIDDMPAMMAQKNAQATPVTPQIQPTPVAAPTPSVAPIITKSEPSVNIPKPQAQPPIQQPVVPQQRSVTPPMSNKAPVNNIPTPAVNNRPVPFVKPQQPPVAVPKPPVQNNAGFAIPGQPASNAAKTPVAPQKQQPANNNTDKKMTFFGLLSHYNKENAELYKKQKEEAKAKKATAPTNMPKPVGAPANNMATSMPNTASSQQPASAPMTPPVSQPFTQPQYQPPVQPVPVQNSFNETTVLSPTMLGGETTVLNAAPAVADPCLTRIKTGERISINKPVFRIGKEKSYVDYFIADNTAISRSHANIHTENGEYFIEDTNSTNHTYINGSLISSNVKTKLKSGDKVRFANEDFTFTV